MAVLVLVVGVVAAVAVALLIKTKKRKSLADNMHINLRPMRGRERKRE